MVDSMAEKMSSRTERQPQDPMAERKGWTRRKFLKGAVQGGGVIVAGTTLGVLAAPHIISKPENATPTEKTTLEILLEKGIKPTNILLGDVKITKGSADGVMLNVRSNPTTDVDSHVTNWVNIEEWNGVNIRYSDSFVIKNALVVEGEFVDNPAGTKGEKGLWIVANVGTNTIGVKNREPKFISFSTSTSGHVSKLNGDLYKIGTLDKNGIITAEGQKIPSKEIGVVIAEHHE